MADSTITRPQVDTGVRTIETGSGQFLMYVPKKNAAADDAKGKAKVDTAHAAQTERERDAGIGAEAASKLCGRGVQVASAMPPLPAGTALKTLTGDAAKDGEQLGDALAAGAGQRTADGAVWVDGVRLDKMASGEVLAEDLYGKTTQFPANSNVAARADRVGTGDEPCTKRASGNARTVDMGSGQFLLMVK